GEGVGFVVMSTKLRRAAESRHRATWRPRFGFSLPPARGRRCFTGFMTTADTAHPHEPHGAGIGQRLNWLRAGVLGANDGIVSVASLVVGVAGATTDNAALL